MLTFLRVICIIALVFFILMLVLSAFVGKGGKK